MPCCRTLILTDGTQQQDEYGVCYTPFLLQDFVQYIDMKREKNAIKILLKVLRHEEYVHYNAVIYTHSFGIG